MIAISGLCKNFNAGDHAVAALRGIDLQVERGEFFVLLGPSGSGKTTLLRSVAGLEKPDQGEIALNGKMVYSRPRRICAAPEEREIGMVFQSYAIWPHLTVAENIGLVLTHGRLRLSKKAAAERMRQSLALVQLEDFENRPARLLSGGQQQRVALARALAVNPALVLMDEPLSNLDARLREEVRNNIKKLASQLGMTVLYVTHDQIESMVLADRIAVMAHGEILQIGNPIELYRRPANTLVAEFFGSMNWIRGRVTAEHRVETGLGVLSVADTRRCEGEVVVGVRPEDVQLEPTSNEGENRIEGKVMGSTFLGDQVVSEVKVGEQTLIAKTAPDDGDARTIVSVYLPKGRLVVFPESAGG
ncbi:MAG TPA: ABC transporter ATP-binding protein [Terriglobales bacterium]|nr:ABC transporter ATP-binding protein [Terriglobales bacterium]